MAQIFEQVKKIISKPPEERETKEIQNLLPWLKKKSELFATMKEDVLIDIARNCDFCTRKRDYVIIKQGEKGDCFYIILRGKVAIYINNQISDEEDESKIAESARHRAEDDDDKESTKELDRSKFGNYIAPLDTGKSFGELALISKDCVRNASIIAEEMTDLLVVKRDLYNRSLKAAQVAEFEERTNFVNDNPLFQTWHQKHKKQLSFSLRKLKLQFDSFIVKQGDKADVMYFILKGQAKLVIDPNFHQHDSNFQFHETSLSANTGFGSSSSNMNNSNNALIITPSALRRQETAKKYIEMSIVGKDEIIGDTEFVLDMHNYIQSVVCTQVTDVFALDMKNYERLVTKRNPKTIQLFREGAMLKLNARVQRLYDHERCFQQLYSILDKLQKTSTKRLPNMIMPTSLNTNISSVTTSTSLTMPMMTSQGINNNIMSSSTEIQAMGDLYLTQRGPLIDMYGPGTVFYRNKMREKAKQAKLTKPQFRATANIHITSTNNPIAAGEERISMARGYTSLMSSNNKNEMFLTKAHDNTNNTTANKATVDGEKLYNDFETNDRALTILEQRIAAWHDAIVENNLKKPKVITKLHRANVQDNKDLKPGKKIILRRRKFGKPREIETNDRPKSTTGVGGHFCTDDENDDDTEENINYAQQTTNHHRHVTSSVILGSPNESPNRFNFHVKKQKKKNRHQYTAEEYADLKKTMLEKRRLLARTLITSSCLF